MTSPQHVYEVRPRKDHRGVDLISDAPPFGRLWYGKPDAIGNAIGYAKSIQLLASRCAFPSRCPGNRGVCGNQSSLTVFLISCSIVR